MLRGELKRRKTTMTDNMRGVAGLNIFYRDMGEGSPVHVMHSAGGTSGQWRKLVKRMSDRHRIIAMDMVSHGKSDRAPPDVNNIYELEVDILSSFVDMTGHPVHLVGHSLGGAVAARFALRYSERVRSLVLFEPTLFQLLANGGHEAGWQDLQRLIDGTHAKLTVGDKTGAARVLIDYWTSPGTFQRMPRSRRP